MGTKEVNQGEVNQDNVITLSKLGVGAEDIASVYLTITEKGADIPKDTYISTLTEMLKFFQARNNHIQDVNTEAIYKEDVLDMIKKNKKLVWLDIDKTIKPVCEKLDSYYFMNPGFTNKLIKEDPRIFNIDKVDLEVYSIILSNFAVNVDGQPVNLLEYVVKQNVKLLESNTQKVFGRIMYIRSTKNTNVFTLEDVEELGRDSFVVSDIELKDRFTLPPYKGESISNYKQIISDLIKKWE